MRLAEEISGAVPRGVNPAYIWGDAITEWEAVAPVARIVNLETSVTRRDEYERGKSIHYRMHPGDITVLSMHWGDNWGYDVPRRHIEFAHRLVDSGLDIVYGHSSHHVRPIEVYHEKLILYGCGDFIDDYEGISGYEHYRDDLVLMFFPSVDPATGRLLSLRMTPLQIRKLRLNRASTEDSHWLCTTLNRISAPSGARVDVTPDGALTLALV